MRKNPVCQHVLQVFFPQYFKLMRCSTQNSSGVNWCRHRVSSGEGSEASRESGSLWCRARSGSTRFRRRCRRRSGRLWCRARSGSTRSGRGSREGAGEGSGEGSGEGLGQSQVRLQGSGEGSGEGTTCSLHTGESEEIKRIK